MPAGLAGAKEIIMAAIHAKFGINKDMMELL
jgi:hypothetical protein